MGGVSTFFGNSLVEVSARQNSSVDIVMYTASLASNPQAIDGIMDDVRIITAHLEPGQVPGEEDVKQLAKVYQRLEGYLVRDEPLRVYTQETIRSKILKKFRLGEDSIEAYWDRATSMPVESKPVPPEQLAHAKHVQALGRRITYWSLGIGAAGLLLPAVPSPEHPWSNNFGMAFSLAAALLLFGGAWLFLKGLPGFKTRFKTTYRLLCAAMVLLALAQSQQVIYTYLGLWVVPFIANGGVAMGFAPAIVLFYVSILLFARLLTIKGFAASVAAALVTASAVAGVSAFLPLPSPLPPEILRQALPPALFMDTLLIFAVFMVVAIKRVAAPAYTPALAWLLLGFIAIAATGSFYTLVQVLLPVNNVILAYGGISALFIVPGLFLVRSAVTFNQITDD